jgi:hypothetical protein
MSSRSLANLQVEDYNNRLGSEESRLGTGFIQSKDRID